MNKITIIDYGIGNLLSVERAFRHIGADLRISSNEKEIKAADKVILPGVGAFSSCVQELEKRNLTNSVRECVENKKPILGICVGMQMLFESSEEFGTSSGFGFIGGKVKAIPTVDEKGQIRRTPHIGWTSINIPDSKDSWDGTLLEGIEPGSEVYFLHSYTAFPENEQERLADSTYENVLISAMVAKENVFGTQFHPEKSGPVGLKILENFIKY